MKDGEVPVINVLDRKWNDDAISSKLELTLPVEVKSLYYSFFSPNLSQKRYDGQTFCMRAMFTAFMGDASNIMSFYGDVDVVDSVGYAVEWWVFKPQRSGQQVGFVRI